MAYVLLKNTSGSHPESLVAFQVPIAPRVLTDSGRSSQADPGTVFQNVDHNAVHRPLPRFVGQARR